MIADLGTRRCTSIDDVNQQSDWINGFPWMQDDQSIFPALTTADISLSAQEKQHLKKESREEIRKEVIDCFVSSTKSLIPDTISDRYRYSKYLIDPNHRRFSTVIRIMAYILKFISACRKSKPTSSKTNKVKSLLNGDDILKSKQYFFRKATQEVKHFNHNSKFKKISEEKDGILYYTGRILPTDQITAIGKATSAMKDLSASTFCVRIIDKNSPLA